MIGKQKIHNLFDGNCDKTFKNLLRGQDKVVKLVLIQISPQKEYLIADLKETHISPRNDKNYQKFWNKLQTSNERDVNVTKKKFIANYVKGELRTNIDFNPPPKV